MVSFLFYAAMQEVVPRAVRAAVRIDTTSWIMAFQVSFFIVVDVLMG